MLEDRFWGQDIVTDKYHAPDANYAMTVRDCIIRASTTASGAAFTITLPPVTEARGRIYSLRMTARNSTKDITITDCGDSDGWTNITFDLAGDTVLLLSDGLMWHIIASDGL